MKEITQFGFNMNVQCVTSTEKRLESQEWLTQALLVTINKGDTDKDMPPYNVKQ